jgi:hypothetical protein
MSMGSFLSSIMTPWQPTPPRRDVAGDILGEAEKAQAAKEADAKQKETERSHRATEATEASKVEGTNKYYGLQAETHKEDVEAKHQDRLEHDFAIAHQAMAKAKTPEERNMARQAMTSAGAALGYTSHDEPSAIPAEATTPEVPDDTSHAYAKPPKANPQTLAAIAGQVNDPNAPQGEGAGQYTSPDQTPALTPMPWESLGGVQGMSTPPEGASSGKVDVPNATAGWKLAGPSKFVLRDKNGAPVYEWDEPLLHHNNAQALQQMAEASVHGALTPEESKAYESAAKEVAPMLDQLGEKEAMNQMNKRVEIALGQYKKRGLGGAGGGIPGLSKAEVGRLGQVETEVDRLVQHGSGREKLTQLTGTEQELDKLDAHLKAGGGIPETLAIVAAVKAANGRAAAQQEFQAVKGAAGAMSNLETTLNHYLDAHGEVSEEVIRQMLADAKTVREAVQKAKDNIGEGVAGEIAHSSIPFKSDEERKTQSARGRGAITGKYEDKSEDERKKKAIEKARKLLGGG